MSYAVYSEEGFVGSLATVEGYGQLRKVIQAHAEKGYSLTELLQDGYVTDAKQAKAEVDVILKSQNLAFQSRYMLKRLSQLLGRVQGVAIVHG